MAGTLLAEHAGCASIEIWSGKELVHHARREASSDAHGASRPAH